MTDWVANIKIEGDRIIWGVVFFLLIFSLLIVYSTSGWNILFGHIIKLAIGVSAMYLVHKIKFKYFSKLGQLAYFLSLGLLVLVFIIGVSVNGASRWLSVAGLQFQPSDIAKLAILLYLARQLSKQRDFLHRLPDLIWHIISPLVLICALVLPNNFSTSALIFLNGIVVMFIAHVRLKLIFSVIISAFILAMSIYFTAKYTSVFSDLLPRSATWILIHFHQYYLDQNLISEYERQEQVEELSQRTAIDLINYLQINIENKDYAELADLLSVDLLIAEKIKKIEAEQLYQQDMNEKFYAINKFEIYLTVFDNKIISELQEGLRYYFLNNEYVRKYHSEYIQSNIKIIKDIDEELQLLNNIRKVGAENHLDVSSVNIVTGKEGATISNQIVLLSQLREEIKTKQKLLEPLVFVQDFAKVNQKEDEVLLWSILVGFLSFILGLFIALIKEVKK